MESISSEETLQSKHAFERVAAAHEVHVKRYYADNERFGEKLLGLPVMSRVRRPPFVLWRHINRMGLQRIGLSF
eukprot:7185078-Ditylum_brightwellii.AAC.2